MVKNLRAKDKKKSQTDKEGYLVNLYTSNKEEQYSYIEAANSIIGPNIWGYYDVEKYTQDIAKAKALLAEAGYPNGFKAKIWVNDNPVRRDTAVILQDQLKQIGIDLTIETVEWGAFLDGTARGDHEMYLLGWGTVTRDPDYGMFELISTSTMGAAGNRSFYSCGFRLDVLTNLLILGL